MILPLGEDRTKVLHALCEVAQTYLRAAEYFCEHYPQTKLIPGYPHYTYENHAKETLKRICKIEKHFDGISDTR